LFILTFGFSAGERRKNIVRRNGIENHASAIVTQELVVVVVEAVVVAVVDTGAVVAVTSDDIEAPGLEAREF